MKLEDHIYKWDRVVIGGNIQSLLYAISKNYPLIFVKPSPPFRFDVVDTSLDLTKLGFKQDKEVSQLEVWETLFFYAGLSGLCPLSSNAESIRIKNQNLVITTKNQRVIKVNFKKLIIFDDTQLKNLPDVVKVEKRKNKVIDWFNVRCGCRHTWDLLYGDGDFINCIYFYPTDRSDNKTLKDATAVSFLDDEELKDIDYSEYMARFKVEDMMKKAGIKGPVNGYRNGKPIYLNIKTEHADREIITNQVRHYKPDSKYEFRYDSFEDSINNFETPDSMRKLFRS
jgi:hypothetical protein